MYYFFFRKLPTQIEKETDLDIWINKYNDYYNSQIIDYKNRYYDYLNMLSSIDPSIHSDLSSYLWDHKGGYNHPQPGSSACQLSKKILEKNIKK